MMDVALIGPLKILLSGLVIYFWYRWTMKGAGAGLQLPFFVVPVFGTLLLLFLVLLGLYDKLVITFLGVAAFGFPLLYRCRHTLSLSNLRKAILFGVLRKTEQPHGKSARTPIVEIPRGADLRALGLPILAVAFLVLTRYLLLHFDAYTLSEIWLYDVGMVRSLNDQSWLQYTDFVSVELIFVNLYHMVTGISEEMALHSFGLIENAILAYVIYVFIRKISGTKNLVPFIAVCWYAAGIAYLPMTVSLLQEHNASYLASCFALPLVGYAMAPGKNAKMTFFIALVTSIVVCLIHAFTALIPLGLLLLATLLLSPRPTRSGATRVFLGWLSGIILTLLCIWLFCFLRGLDFQSAIAQRFISINAYEYYPQLKFPWPVIREFYLYLSGFGLVVGVLLTIGKKGVPHRELAILLAGLAMLGLSTWDQPWLDQAMLNQSLTVVLVLVVGSLFSLLLRSLGALSFASNKIIPISASILCLIFLFSLSGFTALERREHDPLKEEILAVYDELGTGHLPYTYAVVNHSYGQQLSYHEHDFLNYEDFVDTYLQRDSVYQVYKNQDAYLKNNPEVILPESVFVFLSKNSVKAERRLLTSPETRISVEKVIGGLVSRGREVTLYSDGEFLQVYEIVNKRDATTLNELILGL